MTSIYVKCLEIIETPVATPPPLPRTAITTLKVDTMLAKTGMGKAMEIHP